MKERIYRGLCWHQLDHSRDMVRLCVSMENVIMFHSALVRGIPKVVTCKSHHSAALEGGPKYSCCTGVLPPTVVGPRPLTRPGEISRTIVQYEEDHASRTKDSDIINFRQWKSSRGTQPYLTFKSAVRPKKKLLTGRVFRPVTGYNSFMDLLGTVRKLLFLSDLVHLPPRVVGFSRWWSPTVAPKPQATNSFRMTGR